MEWCDPVNDLSPLALPELDCHQLLSQQLSEQLELLENDSSACWESPQKGDWTARCCGQGRMPPGAAAVLDHERLERRWHNLQTTLLSLGPVRQLQRSGCFASNLLLAGDTAVEILSLIHI